MEIIRIVNKHKIIHTGRRVGRILNRKKKTFGRQKFSVCGKGFNVKSQTIECHDCDKGADWYFYVELSIGKLEAVFQYQ